MDQDPQVKKEMDEELPGKALPEEHQQQRSPRSAGGEHHVTLVEISQDPPPENPNVSFSTGQVSGIKEKPLKIKKRHSETETKHLLASDLAGKCARCKQTRTAANGSSLPIEFKSPALMRAEEVQSNLEPAFPSFVKCLVRSHVGSCFWMGLPGMFCKVHLPNKDTTVTLEDECGMKYDMKYIAYKTGLSAGWRQFSVAHQLLEGDVLVFQLVESTTFKVYIIRANDLTEVDGALGLLNLDAQTKHNIADTGALVACKCTKKRRPRSLPFIVQKKNKKNGVPRHGPMLPQPIEQSENDSEEVGSEVLEGYKLTGTRIQFKDIEGFENFKILVDGYSVDSELPEDIRMKYYKLCCSQNAFLHENIIKGVNFKLIAGIISETVNIADAIRACKFTTSPDEFMIWDRTLKAFKLLGMNVGFLRTRLRKLVNLAFESEDATNTRKYVEARTEWCRTEDQIRNLEARLVELKEASERFGMDCESLKLKAQTYELKFLEEVSAPW